MLLKTHFQFLAERTYMYTYKEQATSVGNFRYFKISKLSWKITGHRVNQVNSRLYQIFDIPRRISDFIDSDPLFGVIH